MSRDLFLKLSPNAYSTLQRQAERAGMSPERLVARSLERQYGRPSPTDGEKRVARARFESHFGAVDLGRPTGADNEIIDADLVREYATDHEQG